MKKIRNVLILGLVLSALQPIAVQAQYAAGGGPIGLFGAVVVPQSGQVLGAATVCAGQINSYMRLGRKNNAEDVKKLQKFLAVPVTGFYGNLTTNAVSKFQSKYSDEVLKPWNIQQPTGIMYITTRHKINSLICASQETTLPKLVPWNFIR